jgi:hypothetical protein
MYSYSREQLTPLFGQDFDYMHICAFENAAFPNSYTYHALIGKRCKGTALLQSCLNSYPNNRSVNSYQKGPCND